LSTGLLSIFLNQRDFIYTELKIILFYKDLNLNKFHFYNLRKIILREILEYNLFLFYKLLNFNIQSDMVRVEKLWSVQPDLKNKFL